MNKNKIRTWIVLGIIAAVFSLIVFIIPFDHSGALFWLSYCSAILAIALQVPLFHVSFYSAADNKFRSGHAEGVSQTVLLRSKVYGFPIFRVGYIYFGVQLAMSVIFMMISAFTDEFPIWIAIILMVLVLGAALIGTITADSARDTIESIEQQTRNDTDFMKTLRLDAENLVRKTDDPELSKALGALAEGIRFADPVSNEQMSSYNVQLRKAFDALAEAVSAGDSAAASDLVKKAKDALDDRNAAVKVYK